MTIIFVLSAVFATAHAGSHAKYEGHFNCPFSSVWLKHGAEEAGRILGVEPHARRLNGATTHNIDWLKGFSSKPEDQAMQAAAGDTLVFTWTGTHDVVQMKDSDSYGKCSFAEGTTLPGKDAMKSSYTIPASAKAGDVFYFGCSVGAHCTMGQKMAVTVVTAAAPAAPVQVFGTCTMQSPFAGEMCLEYRGDGWTSESAKKHCDSGGGTGSAGKLVNGGNRCPVKDASQLAGWCMTEKDTIATKTDLTTSCADAQSACKTWSKGTFVWSEKCKSEGAAAAAAAAGGGAGGSNAPAVDFNGGVCSIAPGPMGAAHQLASSPGYASDCKGTPAEGSKYQWPLRWKANTFSNAMKFGSDVIQYSSRGRVWYRLDKNWKRHDLFWQKGTLRAIGQGPCDDKEAGSTFGCDTGDGSSSKNTTVLHRGSKMVFIDWAAEQDTSAITKCSWMDLQVIGNIRPDWFMDKRGESTDTQYLGDQHVYHEGKPRLVKQWRKKDFANQYFTMSMQRIPGADGVHWPLILNIPGEGFGDDQLQHYENHELLPEDAEAPFLLDEDFVKKGGKCPQHTSGSGMAGPPTGQVEHVPSNLELEKTSWRSIEITESPVWKPPPMAATGGGASSPAWQRVSKSVTSESCWDAETSSVRISTTFDTEKLAPWLAVGFRETDECLMTPRGGKDGRVVFTAPSSSTGGLYTVSQGPLPASTKGLGMDSSVKGGVRKDASFSSNLRPLDASDDLSHGSTQRTADDKLVLTFSRKYAAKPAAVHLNYAVGNTANFGYHKARGCFSLSGDAQLASCKTVSAVADNTNFEKKVDCPSPQKVFGPTGTAARAAALPFSAAVALAAGTAALAAAGGW